MILKSWGGHFQLTGIKQFCSSGDRKIRGAQDDPFCFLLYIRIELVVSSESWPRS